MKAVTGLLVLVLSSISFAQSNTSKMKMGSGNSNPLKGFSVGVDYMNITDLKSNVRAHSGGVSYPENKSEGGMSLGVVGVRIGYAKDMAKGFGWQAGTRYLETMNTSETNGAKYQLLIPEANLTYALNPYFSPYAGVNYSRFIAPSTFTDSFSGAFGVQFGMGVRFAKNVQANAGYTMMNQKLSMSEPTYRASGEMRMSGFNANVNYVF